MWNINAKIHADNLQLYTLQRWLTYDKKRPKVKLWGANKWNYRWFREWNAINFDSNVTSGSEMHRIRRQIVQAAVKENKIPLKRWTSYLSDLFLHHPVKSQFWKIFHTYVYISIFNRLWSKKENFFLCTSMYFEKQILPLNFERQVFEILGVVSPTSSREELKIDLM